MAFIMMRESKHSLTTRYSITGLHCNSCVEYITTALEGEYPEVEINISPSLDRITLHCPEDVSTPQVIGFITDQGDYTVTSLAQIEAAMGTISKTNPSITRWSRIKEFYPLALILSYMVGSVTVYAVRHDIDWMRGMELTMGLFYLIFSFFKLLQLRGFVTQFRKYDMISYYLPAYAYFYPVIEILLGTAYIWGGFILVANWITLCLFSMNLVCVWRALRAGKQLECACLGSILSLPLSTVTVVEDTAMIGMSILGIIYS